jgi:hypothetical protein
MPWKKPLSFISRFVRERSMRRVLVLSGPTPIPVVNGPVSHIVLKELSSENDAIITD